jgi:DinB superfamily
MPVSKKIQEIVDSVTGHRQALIDSISGLSEAQLDYKPEEGKWAISDILHHLALTDEANLKLISRMVKQATALNVPPDPTPDGSEINCLAPHADTIRNTKAEAPEFVRPQSHEPAEKSLARLEESRKRFMELVEQLGRYDLTQLKYPHPLLGEMNMYQWLVIAGGHERRHAGQIERIKSQPGFPQ